MKELTKEDLDNILLGCAVLGTGGGGSLKAARRIIEADLTKGGKFLLADAEDLDPEAIVASPYFCGALVVEEETRGKESESLIAFRSLEDFIGKKISAVIGGELGAENTAVALSVASNVEIPLVDADPAGRSVPELQHSTFFLNDIPIAPMAVANRFGDVVIVKQVANHFHAESIVRNIAIASGNRVGVADSPVKVRVLRKSAIPKAISLARKIGETIRKAIAKQEDLAEAIATTENGKLLFKGTVEKDSEWKNEGGFTVGTIQIKGRGEYQGSDYKIWYKNENIIAWKDGEIDITVPDLICVLNEETGEPIINPEAKKGMNVTVVGFPAPEQWKTERGIEVFGPKSFGFDVEYVPIEMKK